MQVSWPSLGLVSVGLSAGCIYYLDYIAAARERTNSSSALTQLMPPQPTMYLCGASCSVATAYLIFTSSQHALVGSLYAGAAILTGRIINYLLPEGSNRINLPGLGTDRRIGSIICSMGLSYTAMALTNRITYEFLPWLAISAVGATPLGYHMYVLPY